VPLPIPSAIPVPALCPASATPFIFALEASILELRSFVSPVNLVFISFYGIT
jgi:hypothetical protein